MKIIGTKVQVYDNESGRVLVGTNYGTFFRNFTFEALSETISFEQTDATEPHLIEEFFSDEYDAIDAMDFTDQVSRNPEFKRICKDVQDEEEYFRKACGGCEYAYHGVSRNDF